MIPLSVKLAFIIAASIIAQVSAIFAVIIIMRHKKDKDAAAAEGQK